MVREDSSIYLSKSDLVKFNEISEKTNTTKTSILRRIINEMYKLVIDYDTLSFAVTQHRSGQAVGIILIPIEVWAGKFEDEKLGDVKQNV